MHSVKGAGESAGSSIVGGDFIPDKNTVVSPEALAQVFEDQKLPFQTNPDGSVDMSVYMTWLNEVGRVALQAFDECFEVENGELDPPVARRA